MEMVEYLYEFDYTCMKLKKIKITKKSGSSHETFNKTAYQNVIWVKYI
jgi:hypothetical protein